MADNYYSVYSIHIKQFLELKRKLGFKYKTEESYLKEIDRIAIKTNQSSLGITKMFADTLKHKKPNETKQNQHKRISVLAAFSSYLNDLGINSYIPKLPPYPYKKNYIPYIFSKKEIKAIFTACDNLISNKRNIENNLFSMPALLRLLYATGIRIGEALNLKDDDINLDEKYILISDSKNKKERVIPISASLTNVLKEYLWYRSYLPRNSHKYFFVNISGNKCSSGVRSWFKKCLEHAKIPYIGEKKGPRIHDLRHTFAVNSLVQMVESGLDLYASLPILSNYLGHQSIKSTNHYVRLTSMLYPDLINEINYSFIDVFPKFNNYETD